MSCTCCVCAGLPLTRGFGAPGYGFDPTTTKIVTWADNLPDSSVVVDGQGPIEMQGSSGWESSNNELCLVFSGSSVTFKQLDGPSFSFGTYLFPHLSQTNLPADIEQASGSITASLYGQSATVSYELTLDTLDASVKNARYVDKSDEFDPPYVASADVTQQLQSQTIVTIPGVLGVPPYPLAISSVLDQSLSSTGTTLQEFTERTLDNLKDLLCWREVLNPTVAKWNIQDVQSGGVSQSPPIDSGYTLAHTLEFAGDTRLLLTPGTASYTPLSVVSLDCLITSSPTAEQLPTSGFWTATALRPAIFAPALQTVMNYEVTGPTGVGAPYIKGNLTGLNRSNVGFQNTSTGMLFSLTRDGTEVLAPTQAPTRQQLVAATADEGSYLVTVTPTGSYGSAYTLIPTNKDFFSFVIDRTKPVIGFAAIDDRFVLTGEQGETAPPTTVVTSTKPLGNPAIEDDESSAGVCARPLRNVWLRNNTGTAEQLAWTAGTYTLSLPYTASQCSDRANNNPQEMFSQSWTVHAKHANYRRQNLPGGHSYYGAIPQLEQPGLQTREYYRARLQSEKIGSLLLTFDKPVDPQTVKDSHGKFFCNGVNTGGCTIEQADETTKLWRITIPTAAQQSATFCLLEYDPSGEVMTAETFPEVHYPTKDDFPTDSQRYADLFRVVFVADDDNERYSVSVNPSNFAISYVNIGGGNPLDWNGNAYDPEPSVIVARASWLMADTNGWPRLIDTSSIVRGFVIGRAASIGKSRPVNMQANNLSIACAGDFGISTLAGIQSNMLPQQPFEDFGLVASAVTYDGYIPRVPTSSSSDAFSYWGLGTTIDPSEPAIVPPCAAPSEDQWHSSAIACASEITNFEARIVLLDEYGNEVQPPLDSDVPGTNIVFYSNGKVTFGQPAGTPPEYWDGAPPGGFNHVALDLFPRIMASSDSNPPPPVISLGTQFASNNLAQNLWAGVIGGGGVEINAMPMATKLAYFIDGNTVTSSPYWTQPDPHFAFEFDSAEKTFGDSETTLEEAKDGLRLTTSDLTPVAMPALSDSIRSVTDARYSFEGGHAVLSAYRQAKTFPALKTTTLGPLILTLSLRACIKAETDYEDNEPSVAEFVRELRDPNSQVVYQSNVSFDTAMDWILDTFAGYDPTENTWKIPSFRWGMYCTRGSKLADRTITERVLKDYVHSYVLTPDDETALASGAEITMPLVNENVGLPYMVKLKKV